MWGSNPFTNYQQTPNGGSYGNMGQNVGNGQSPWGSGEFNPTALNFGGGMMQGFNPYGGYGQGGYGMSQGMQQMPPWAGGMMGGYGSGMGGGMSGGMLGMNPASRGGMPQGGMQMPRTDYRTMPYALGNNPQPEATAAAPGGPNGIYGNVVHNGSFDSAGAQLNPLLRSMIQS